MFQGLFHSLNGGKLNFEIFIEDLPRDKLTARSALWACAKDQGRRAGFSWSKEVRALRTRAKNSKPRPF